MKSALVIYHASCCDGSLSAAIVRNALAATHELTFVPYQYGELPPDSTMLIDKDEVYIVDFSFRNDEEDEHLNDLCQFCVDNKIKLVIIDHHRTSEEQLCRDVAGKFGDDVTVVFDKEFSGCRLAWRYFNEDKRDELTPLAVKWVEDRDLWRWKYEQSKPFNAALGLLDKNDIREWETLLSDEQAANTLKDGRLVQKYLDQKIDSRLEGWKEHRSYVSILGVKMPIINNTDSHITSELVGALAKMINNESGVACGYFDTNTHRVFNLRSRGAAGDSSAGNIAEAMGGGGHANAAGFSLPLTSISGVMTERMFEAAEFLKS